MLQLQYNRQTIHAGHASLKRVNILIDGIELLRDLDASVKDHFEVLAGTLDGLRSRRRIEINVEAASTSGEGVSEDDFRAILADLLPMAAATAERSRE